MESNMKPLSRVLTVLFLAAAATPSVAEPLSLWDAMERAAQANPALRSQQVELSRQTLEQDIAHGQRLPKLDLNAGYTRYAYPSLVTPIREAGVFPPLDRDVANIGLALSLPLYSGGKLIAGEALAAHNREASAQALRASGQDLLFNVVATYTKALHFRQLGKVLDARIKTLQQEEKNIGLRIEQGRAARLELIRLQTQLSQARYDKVSITQGEKDALSLLASLLGESGLAPTLADPGKTTPALPASIEEAKRQALQHRPDMLRLLAAGKAAQEKTTIARGERLPQINLVAKAQESAGSDWEGYDDWQLGVQLSMPLFDGDIRRRRVEQAGLEQRQNTLLQEDVRNRLASETEQAFGALSEAQARLQAATQGETEADEALRIETLRYHSGENTITDLLSAESALWSATASRLQAGYDITLSQAQLLRTIGALAADSFKPALPDRNKDAAVLPVSGLTQSDLAHYLAWHRWGMDSGNGVVAQSSAAGTFHNSGLAGASPSGHFVKQGTKL
jgi:outer membrane protein TolC